MILYDKECIGYLGNCKIPNKCSTAIEHGYKGIIFCTNCNYVLEKINPIWAFNIITYNLEVLLEETICPDCKEKILVPSKTLQPSYKIN